MKTRVPTRAKNVLIAIHGVGAPVAGELKAQIETNINTKFSDVNIIEINWNTIVDQSLKDNLIQYTSVTGLYQSLTLASRITGSELHRNAFAAFLYRCLGIIFECIEVLQFFLLLLLAVAVPGVLLQNYLLDARWMTNVVSIGRVAVYLYGAVGVLFVTYLTIAALRALTDGQRGLFPSDLRRIVLLLLKPPMLMYTPFFLAFPKAFSKEGPLVVFLRFFIFVLLLSWVITGIFAGFTDESLFNLFSQAKGYSIVLAVILAGSVATVVLNVLLIRAFGPVLKIFLDIFRYVSDDTYRSRILQHCDDTLSAYFHQKDTNVFIIAHSLGTVIMTDYLLNFNKNAVSNQVTFVTMGSPLKRCFFRFFPNLFFPSSAPAIAQRLCSQYRQFRWINLYRPFDQVGTSIGLMITTFTREYNSRQFKGYVGSHINYFSDPVVRDLLTKAFGEVDFCVDAPTDLVAVPYYATYKHRQSTVLARLAALILMVCRGLVVVLYAATLVQLFTNDRAERDKTKVALEQGIPVNAEVTSWVTEHTQASGDLREGVAIITHYNFVFRYITQSGATKREEFLGDDKLRFDDSDLSRYVAEHCDATLPVPPQMIIGEYATDDPVCIHKSLRIRYLPNDEAFFIIPQFPYSTWFGFDFLGLLFKSVGYAFLFGILLWLSVSIVNVYLPEITPPIV